MKKIYMQPQTDVCETLPVQMLAASGVTGTGAAEFDYGGKDEEGTIIPGVKGNEWGDIWD